MQGVGLAVDAVAAEELVRALPGHHHPHMPGGLPGQEVQGYRGGIPGGLVHMVQHLRHRLPELLLGDPPAMLFQMQLLRQLPGQGDFIVVPVLLAVAHGEGLASGKLRGDQAGVHAAGQKCPHLHVRYHMGLHGIPDGCVQPVHPFLLRCPFPPSGLFRREHGQEITLWR